MVAQSTPRIKTTVRLAEPFAVVPAWLITAGVSDRAFRLYALLVRYANPDRRAWPYRSRLAKELRCSTDSVDRAVRELVDLGVLETEQQYHDDGRQIGNLYTIHVRPFGRDPEPDEDDPADGDETAPVRPGVGHDSGGGLGKAAEGGWAPVRHNRTISKENDIQGTRSKGVLGAPHADAPRPVDPPALQASGETGKRPANPVWDALAFVLQSGPANPWERGKWNRAEQMIRGAYEEQGVNIKSRDQTQYQEIFREVVIRAERLVRAWGRSKLTVSALATNWGHFAVDRTDTRNKYGMSFDDIQGYRFPWELEGPE